MKKTDKQVLQEKSPLELQKLIEEAYNTLGQLKLDNVQGKLKNTRSIFNTRQEIAIMRSLLNLKVKATPVAPEAPAEEDKKVNVTEDKKTSKAKGGKK